MCVFAMHKMQLWQSWLYCKRNTGTILMYSLCFIESMSTVLFTLLKAEVPCTLFRRAMMCDVARIQPSFLTKKKILIVQVRLQFRKSRDI